MPELDAAVLCDYVRSEGGIAHIIAAGIDRVTTAQVPTGQNVGLYILVKFTRMECDRPHRVEVIFQTEDGARLVQVEAAITPEWMDDTPAGWKQGAVLALNLGLPLPQFGIYSLEILINDRSEKTIPLRVVQVPQPPDQE